MRTGMAVGGVAMLVVAGAVAFGAEGNFDGVGTWFGPDHRASTRDTMTRPVRAVDFDTGAGSVEVHAADIDRVAVQRTLRYDGRRPGRTFRVDGGRLRLSGCGDECTVDYTVIVPRRSAPNVTGKVSSGDVTLDGVRSVRVRATSGRTEVQGASEVDLRASSGDVTARGVRGTARVGVSSGNVQLADIGGTTTASATSGDIAANGLRRIADARTTSGTVSLRMAAAADVRARATSGDIQVTVPPNTPYRLRTQAQDGNVDAIPSTRGAPHLIDAEVGSGTVEIRTGR